MWADLSQKGIQKPHVWCHQKWHFSFSNSSSIMPWKQGLSRRHKSGTGFYKGWKDGRPWVTVAHPPKPHSWTPTMSVAFLPFANPISNGSQCSLQSFLSDCGTTDWQKELLWPTSIIVRGSSSREFGGKTSFHLLLQSPHNLGGHWNTKVDKDKIVVWYYNDFSGLSTPAPFK